MELLVFISLAAHQISILPSVALAAEPIAPLFAVAGPRSVDTLRPPAVDLNPGPATSGNPGSPTTGGNPGSPTTGGNPGSGTTGGNPGSPTTGGLPDITPDKKLEDILRDIIGYSVGFALALAGLAIIYAGYQMLFAGGDPAKFGEGLRTIKYTIIALVVVLLSSAVVALIRKIIMG